MISACRASASATIAGPAARARSRRADDRNAVRVADRDRLVELAVRERLELGHVVRERAVERHLDHRHGDDARPALGGEPAGDVERLVRRLARHDRHEDAAVLERERGAECGRRLDDLAAAARARSGAGRPS